MRGWVSEFLVFAVLKPFKRSLFLSAIIKNALRHFTPDVVIAAALLAEHFENLLLMLKGLNLNDLVPFV